MWIHWHRLKKAQMCLWHVILKRWASMWCRWGEFCEIILAYILTKSNWRKNWSCLTTRSVVCWWIGLSHNLKMIRIFIEKSSSAMRLISGWMASSINKICIIGQTAIHTYSMSHHCIPKKFIFGAVYGPAASLGRNSTVMIKTGTLLWMGIATVQWSPNIFGPKWMT